MSKMSYRESGVNIDEGNRLVEKIKPMVKSTFRPEVMTGIGGFSSMVSIPKGLEEPVLVSGTDGVGTKLKFAFMAEKFDTIGIDLVAMCVNDILVTGAEPLYFLDYYATGALDADVAADVVEGIAEGCRQSEAALVGGETAEMPGFYSEGEFDVAGFAVGVVDKKNIIDGSKIGEGDVLVGLPSSGIHSNGYSLVRKVVFEKMGLSINDRIEELDAAVGDIFLTPTVIYVKKVKELLKSFEIKGMVHITGGGFYENIPRVVPEGLSVEIDGDFPVLPVFSWLKEKGDIEEREMFRTFNCGIGMVLVVDREKAAEIAEKSGGYIIGSVVRKDGEEGVEIKRNYF